MPSPEPADYPPMTKVVSLTLSHVAKDAVIGMAVARAAAGAVGTGARRLESMGWDDRGVWVLLICATHFACWVGMALPFVLCDHFGLLQWYKLRRKPAQQAPNALWARLWADAALGQFVTAPLAAYAIYPAVRYFGAPKVADPLPASSWDLALGLVAAHVFNDFGFYATHRLLHEFPVLYRTIHKKVRVRANLAPPSHAPRVPRLTSRGTPRAQHHSWTGSVAPAAEFAHPFESFFSNQLPTIGGCVLLGSHPVVLCVWIASRLFQTYEAHSGYCFRGDAVTDLLNAVGILNAQAVLYHDHHHTVNSGCYGSFLLDWSFGTLDAYVKAGGDEGYLRRSRWGPYHARSRP